MKPTSISTRTLWLERHSAPRYRTAEPYHLGITPQNKATRRRNLPDTSRPFLSRRSFKALDGSRHGPPVFPGSQVTPTRVSTLKAPNPAPDQIDSLLIPTNTTWPAPIVSPKKTPSRGSSSPSPSSSIFCNEARTIGPRHARLALGPGVFRTTVPCEHRRSKLGAGFLQRRGAVRAVCTAGRSFSWTRFVHFGCGSIDGRTDDRGYS
ncbi:hypothetical protein B0T11DRAFT_65233 [Plectosphaerella cucumerina]|jgi:hypothetical protein|uniref:Uncharacterized protein n=1 Tax=Plectosphaerella cucumerina TaxID=40658 RepID=A0A8K0TSE7_9PEZI|nr:hypothetical protein B0T11DRAFT_65233 [Plectosphaerella cucumerina]